MISDAHVSSLTTRCLLLSCQCTDCCHPTAPKFQGDNFYKNKAIVEEIKKLAKRKGCTTTQLALAWVASQGMIPIVGTTKSARLEENWGCRGIDLTKDELVEMRRIIEEAKPEGERFSTVHQSMVGH